jgi:hypothetical protein
MRVVCDERDEAAAVAELRPEELARRELYWALSSAAGDVAIGPDGEASVRAWLGVIGDRLDRACNQYRRLRGALRVK